MSILQGPGVSASLDCRDRWGWKNIRNSWVSSQFFSALDTAPCFLTERLLDKNSPSINTCLSLEQMLLSRQADKIDVCRKHTQNYVSILSVFTAYISKQIPHSILLRWSSDDVSVWAETYGDWGDGSPKKIEVGDGPCIRPPNILRSSVCRTCEKARIEKKGMYDQGIIFWNRVFSGRKVCIRYDAHVGKRRKICKNSKIMVDD